MTSHVGRLYAAAVAILAFCLVWAVLAAHPWVSARPSAQLQLLAQREQALRRETSLVNRIVAQRAAAARAWRATSAAVPAVRVVTLPPLTITRTS